MNFLWQSWLGLKNWKVNLKICQKWKKGCFAVRMEWVNSLNITQSIIQINNCYNQVWRNLYEKECSHPFIVPSAIMGSVYLVGAEVHPEVLACVLPEALVPQQDLVARDSETRETLFVSVWLAHSAKKKPRKGKKNTQDADKKNYSKPTIWIFAVLYMWF